MIEFDNPDGRENPFFLNTQSGLLTLTGYSKKKIWKDSGNCLGKNARFFVSKKGQEFWSINSTFAAQN
jgi:hypothetical protein